MEDFDANGMELYTKVKETEDSIALLEKNFISTSKEISSKNIELEEKRKEVRKQRQMVLNHEKKIEMMKIQLKKKQMRFQRADEAVKQYNEANKIYNKVKTELGTLTSMETDNEVDYDQFLHEKYQNLKKTLNSLVIRKKCAQEVLRKDTDDPIFEEIQSNQLEDEVILQEKKLQYTEETEVTELQEIETMCSNNDIRRKALEQKATLLKEEESKYSALKIKKVKTKKAKKLNVKPPVQNDTATVDESIQKIISTITKRKKKLSLFKKKTKVLATNNEEKRKAMEEEYNQKTNLAARYKKRITNVYSLRQLIEDERPKIKSTKSKLDDLISIHDSINRRIENIIRDRNSNTKRKDEIEKLMQLYNEKKEKYEGSIVQIKEKKKQYSIQTGLYEQREKEVDDKKNKVIELEKQVKEMETKIQEAQKELKVVSAQTDAAKKTYAELHRNDSVKRLEDGIREPFV